MKTIALTHETYRFQAIRISTLALAIAMSTLIILSSATLTAQTTVADIKADNGIVRIVDAVITPAAPMASAASSSKASQGSGN